MGCWGWACFLALLRAALLELPLGLVPLAPLTVTTGGQLQPLVAEAAAAVEVALLVAQLMNQSVAAVPEVVPATPSAHPRALAFRSLEVAWEGC